MKIFETEEKNHTYISEGEKAKKGGVKTLMKIVEEIVAKRVMSSDSDVQMAEPGGTAEINQLKIPESKHTKGPIREIQAQKKHNVGGSRDACRISPAHFQNDKGTWCLACQVPHDWVSTWPSHPNASAGHLVWLRHSVPLHDWDSQMARGKNGGRNWRKMAGTSASELAAGTETLARLMLTFPGEAVQNFKYAWFKCHNHPNKR